MANAYQEKSTTNDTDYVLVTESSGSIFRVLLSNLLSGGGGGYVEKPTYSNSPGVKGQWSFDSAYIYVCTATDTWDRFPVTWEGWDYTSTGIVSASVDATGSSAG